MNNRLYVGLDVATKLGIALWKPLENVAHVEMVKGEPVDQVVRVLEVAGFGSGGKNPVSELVFVMETLPSFQNARTTRSLLERYGYLKHTLKCTGFPVMECNISSIRHSLGVNKKMQVFDYFLPYYRGTHLTTDHTDALATAIHQSMVDLYPYDKDSLIIHDVKKEVEDAK
jgi:hypothetical protein